MKIRAEWAEEHWDVIAMVAAFLIVIAIGAVLGIVYNVAVVGLDASTPAPAVEVRSPAGRPEPGPARPPAPIS
jgi:hypothetical protein